MERAAFQADETDILRHPLALATQRFLEQVSDGWTDACVNDGWMRVWVWGCEGVDGG